MKKVLIVDDEQMNRFLLECYLKNYGCAEIFEAKNGKEAIEKAGEIQPDVIFMDFRMSEMNGGQSAKFIKENISKDIFIVLITAYNLNDLDESKDLMQYFDYFMNKPIDQRKFNKLIKDMAP